jgi:hypothetical protein
MPQAPAFESWTDLWTAFTAQVGGCPHILILDEVPHAAEADPAFLSALQHAWDQHFKPSKLYLLLIGSHVHTLDEIASAALVSKPHLSA